MTVANLNCRVRQGVAKFDMTFYMKVNIPCCVVSFARPGCGVLMHLSGPRMFFFHKPCQIPKLVHTAFREKKKSHNEVLIIYCFRVLDVPVICRILGGGEDRNVAAVNGKQLRQALLA